MLSKYILTTKDEVLGAAAFLTIILGVVAAVAFAINVGPVLPVFAASAITVTLIVGPALAAAALLIEAEKAANRDMFGRN